MAEAFCCKIASLEEMNRKWEYEIARHEKGRENWVIWKKRNMERYRQGRILPYYGILVGRILCEATAMTDPNDVQNSEGLVDDRTVYLSAFRTIDGFEGKGYFSKLFRFMIEDLRRRGYTRATLGVEPANQKNKAIYAHYGFTEFVKSGMELEPDETAIAVEYYAKSLEGGG